MQAWESSPAAWIDRADAWLPAGRDDTVLAGLPSLVAGAFPAAARGDADAAMPRQALTLTCGGVSFPAGVTVPAGSAVLALCGIAASPAWDARADPAGGVRLVLVANRAADGMEGWRILRPGASEAARTVHAASRPTARAAFASSLVMGHDGAAS